MREWSDDVLFGMIKLSSSPAARLAGRDSPERGLEVKDGAIVTVVILFVGGRDGVLRVLRRIVPSLLQRASKAS